MGRAIKCSEGLFESQDIRTLAVSLADLCSMPCLSWGLSIPLLKSNFILCCLAVLVIVGFSVYLTIGLE